ncbi:MAG: response regulator [Desulfamplus sp.]|nr:response regulator [Desulfamplus sp.]
MSQIGSYDDFFARENGHSQDVIQEMNDGKYPSDVWKILVVDDDEDVHTITKFALGDFKFEDQSIEVMSAFSSREAKGILNEHPDIAMVFLDVVMETHDAGFELVNYIRDDLNNSNIRIVMRTGQPADETEDAIIRSYRIDDYKNKTELTSGKLFATVIASLKTYGLLTRTDGRNQQLEAELLQQNAVLQSMNAELVEEIGKRQKTELELKASEKRFRSLYENLDVTLKSISDGVISIDRDERVIFMNSVAEKMTGWRLSEAQGKPFPDIFNIFRVPKASGMTSLEISPRSDIEAEDIHLLSMEDATTVSRYHTLLKSRGGIQALIEYSSSPITKELDEPDSPGRVIIFRDVTEKINMERRLMDAQRMESLGVLAGGIAHDFNNILASILGFTDLLLFDAPKGSEQEEYLNEIMTAGTRAKELIRQILTFARHTVQSIQPIQVALIAKETLKLLRSSIPTTISINSDIRSKASVMADPTQLHQIFMNLFTNAAHAMNKNGGTLTLTMEDVELSGRSADLPISLAPGRYIKIMVSDTGTGIPRDIIHSIFEPYFTTKKDGEGTGMGLALVHGIIENYKGSITVKSLEDLGSTFTIHMPVTENPVQSGSDSMSEDEKNSEKCSGRVLLVDDEVAIVKVGKLLLERSGFRVTETTNSIDALDIFSSRPRDFDIVITDMTMPHMTGDVLARRIREVRPEIPIVMCTGYTKQLSRKEALAAGFNGYIKKPFNKDEIVNAIRDVLYTRQC